MLKSILILLFYLRISFAKDNFDVLSYDISLRTNLANVANDELKYNGTVDIGMIFHEGSVKLRIPRGDYEITMSQLSETKTYKDTQIPGMMHDPVKAGDEYFVFNKKSVKTNTPYIFRIQFEGILRHDDKGLYHYKHQGHNSAFAGFKGRNGHLSIPCFDDFSTRANVTVKSDNLSMFNISIRKDRSKRYWHHEITQDDNKGEERKISGIEYKAIPMYMLGLVVGQFQLVANVTDHNRTFDLVTSNEVSIPSPDEDKIYDECALNISTTLVWIEKFFNVSSLAEPNITVFMLPEVLPNLVDNNKFIYYPIQAVLNMNETLEDKHYFRLLTATKMALMYLANLLLPEKGKDFWVNHGLSIYLQFKVMGGLYTEYDFEQLVFLESRSYAMKVDIDPVVRSLNSESVSERFARRKGSCLFWMLESVFSEKTFKKALHQFIQTHREKSVNASHLADSFTNFTSEIPNAPSLLDMLNSWTNQTGYPIIRIHRASGNDIHVTQQLFGSRFNNFTQRWVVPVKLPGKNLFWAQDNILEFYTNDWKLANLEVQGYYLVDYDETIWTDIIKKLKNKDSFKDITTLNRARLIDDSFNLAMTNSSTYNYTYALQILDYLEHEDEYLPWAIVYDNIRYLIPLINGTKGATTIQTIVGKHAWAVYRNKFAASETNFIYVKTLKNLLLNLACSCENQDCLDFFKKNYTEPSLVNIGTLDRHTSCCYAARASNEFANKVYEAFKATSDREAKDFYLQCAACDKRYNETIEKWNKTLNPYEMNQFLQQMISTSYGHADVVRKFMWKAEKCCSDDVRERHLYCGSIRAFKVVIKNTANYIVTNEAILVFDKFLNDATSLRRNSKPCEIVTNADLYKLKPIYGKNRDYRQQQYDAMPYKKPEPKVEEPYSFWG